jgi:hypothetical protein
MLRCPACLRAAGRMVKVRDATKLVVVLKNDEYVGKTVLQSNKVFEEDTINIMLDYIRPGTTVVEAGGCRSCWLLRCYMPARLHDARLKPCSIWDVLTGSRSCVGMCLELYPPAACFDSSDAQVLPHLQAPTWAPTRSSSPTRSARPAAWWRLSRRTWCTRRCRPTCC